MVVDKIQGVALDPQSVITPVRHVAGLIQQKTGYDLWSESNLQSVLGYLPRAGQWLVGGIVNFAVNLVVLLFVLYFMLIGGLRMETYCREILPFDRCAARSVMRESHMIVRSNAIVIPLLAVADKIAAIADVYLRVFKIIECKGFIRRNLGFDPVECYLGDLHQPACANVGFSLRV